MNPTPPISTPVPDPTVLTTEALRRDVSALKDVIQTRLDALDEARRLQREHMDRVPSEVDSKVLHLRELTEEQFKSIALQFKERDTRTEQTSKDSKVAVDAALQAAKEAVGEQNKSSALAIAKSEAATTKQIDQLGTLIQTTTKGSDEKISDLKERLTLIEGRAAGGNQLWGYIVGGVGLLLAMIAIFVTLSIARADRNDNRSRATTVEQQAR